MPKDESPALCPVLLPTALLPQAILLSFEQYQRVLTLVAATDKVLQNIRILHAEDPDVRSPDLDVLNTDAACDAIAALEAAYQGQPSEVEESPLADDEIPF